MASSGKTPAPTAHLPGASCPFLQLHLLPNPARGQRGEGLQEELKPAAAPHRPAPSARELV